MKTDIAIRDDVYSMLMRSPLTLAVKGEVYTRRRPAREEGECIVIGVLANCMEQSQRAYVNVNIYVPDVTVTYPDGTRTLEEDTPRLRELCKVATQSLSSVFGDDWWLSLSEQRIHDAVEETGGHMINNKCLYRHIDEEV